MSLENKQSPPIFRRINYIIMIVGILFLVVGYILLSGGAAEDPEHFNPEIFNTRRIVVAPIVMLIGLILGIVAIMYCPKIKSDNPTEE